MVEVTFTVSRRAHKIAAHGPAGRRRARPGHSAPGAGGPDRKEVDGPFMSSVVSPPLKPGPVLTRIELGPPPAPKFARFSFRRRRTGKIAVMVHGCGKLSLSCR